MRMWLAALLALIGTPAAAQERVSLWPTGAPGYEARRAIPEKSRDYWTKSVNDPSIAAYLPLPENRTSTAVVIVPGNMYGEYDNFHPLDSHVVPAMIRRYHEARLDGLEEVAMWGTGRPERDFVHAGDVARTIPFFLEQYSSEEWVNISSGVRTAKNTRS